MMKHIFRKNVIFFIDVNYAVKNVYIAQKEFM